MTGSVQLTEDNLEQILDSGDPEQIEAALAQLEETEEGFTIKDEASATDADAQDDAAKELAGQDADAATKDNAAQDENQAGAEDAQGGEGAAYIEGKHGNGKIPYAVLEAERKRSQDAERQNRELEQKLAEQSEKDARAERQLEMLTNQLEKNGLDPETLPEDFKLTDELKQQLVDDFGDAGKAMVALYARMDQVGVTSQSQPGANQTQEGASSGNPVMDAIARNDVLEGWRTGTDTDHWKTAVTIDQQLQKDPKFANASLDDRFAEAVKRTQLAFGESVDAGGAGKDSLSNTNKLDAAVEEAENNAALPASLSSMGVGGASSEKSLAEQLVDMSEDEMTAKLESMPASQREAVLADLGF